MESDLEDGTANNVSASIEQDGFEAMVAELNLEEQQILSLRFVGDLPLAEIAQVMGGLSATKMRFYRALEKLKDSL